jgi:tetratricopeptide (TPR) repeat protein
MSRTGKTPWSHVITLTQRSLGTSRTYWLVPFTRNKRFVGRSPELNELEAKLFVEGPPAKVAIIGLGGVGKTQIALELAYRRREERENCSIFWVTATSMESFEQAYLEIGGLLQIPGVADEKSDVKMLVKNHLSQETAGEWLMILDNADDADLWFKDASDTTQLTAFIDYIPRSSKGSIVCTTRDRRAAVKMAQSNVLEVLQMDEDVATEVLKKSLIHPGIADDPETVSKLLEQLTFLPLAIVQAAAYINENGISILEYLSLFEDTEENIVAVLSEDFEDDGRYRESKNPVATTWLISFEQIQHRDPLAAEYLSFMSCLDPNKIPKSLLPPAQPKKKVIDAIGTLSAYSLITKRPTDQPVDDQSFDLHRLVHLATRNWLREQGAMPGWAKKAVARLAEIFPNRDHENRTMWTAYLPHARHILGPNLLEESSKERIVLLEKIALCLVIDGKYDEAKGMQLCVFEWKKRTLGEVHLDTLSSAHNLAEALERAGNYQEAEILNWGVFKAMKKILGQEHLDTLTSMANLASTYWNQGRWKEAEELELQVMEMSLRVLGQEHPATLMSMANLASTYQNQGRWKEAEELGVQVMEMRKRVLGQEHPHALTRADEHE